MMMPPRWWWLPLALARHGPPPRPVADDASGRCNAPRNCSAPPEATGAVHVMASKAGWGGHDNYYHYFYGRLVPLLHWFAATRSSSTTRTSRSAAWRRSAARRRGSLLGSAGAASNMSFESSI